MVITRKTAFLALALAVCFVLTIGLGACAKKQADQTSAGTWSGKDAPPADFNASKKAGSPIGSPGDPTAMKKGWAPSKSGQ